MIRISFFLCLTCLVFGAGEVSAGWQDQLKNLANPETKEGKILSGATQVLSSQQEMSYQTERTIGESLALEGMQRFGKPVKNEALQQYVNLVGTAVARNSKRPTIPYEFVVLDSPIYNAFATPGGIIFISKALIKILDNEAELAAVLAHEVGHVAEKHAIRSIQRAQFLQGVGSITAATMKGSDGKKFETMIGDLQNVLFDKGLDKGMEFEADLDAMETTYRTGYNPTAMAAVLFKLKKLAATSNKSGSWFSTHPPLDDRLAKMAGKLGKYPDYASLALVSDRFKKKIKGL